MEKLPSEKSVRQWLRIWRPLFWWLILVLVMLGIRTHQRLMEHTRLDFVVTMQGQPLFNAAVTLDGKPAYSGQKIPLGNHIFAVTHPKGETFSTNLFIWYGEHNFGTIDLKRTYGNLAVIVNPPADWLVIRGPEWSVTLKTSSGTNATVPTDTYEVEADFPHWQEKQSVTVAPLYPNSVRIAPQFGVLQLDCNQADATYQLQDANGQNISNGSLPATVTELPVGTYKIIATHHARQRENSVFINSGTNTVPMNFDYGAATFETKPSGATVTGENGRQYGDTPLTLTELLVGDVTFTLQRYGYAPVQVTLTVTANQTNVISTNLVSVDYLNDLAAARHYETAGNFTDAMRSANSALAISPGDPATLALQQSITVNYHFQTASQFAAESNYTAAVTALNAILEIEPDNKRAKQLIANYQKGMADQTERERVARLNRPQQFFDEALSRYPAASLFDSHETNAVKSAADVAAAIRSAFRDQTPAFSIFMDGTPAHDITVLEFRQMIPDGSRTCVVVTGQTTDTETKILFKVLEFKAVAANKFSMGALMNVPLNKIVTAWTDKNYVPLDPSHAGELTDAQKTQIQAGAQIVAGIIQKAIQPAQ